MTELSKKKKQTLFEIIKKIKEETENKRTLEKYLQSPVLLNVWKKVPNFSSFAIGYLEEKCPILFNP